MWRNKPIKRATHNHKYPLIVIGLAYFVTHNLKKKSLSPSDNITIKNYKCVVCMILLYLCTTQIKYYSWAGV